MQGSHGRWRCERESPAPPGGIDSHPAAAVLLAPFSTRIPPTLLERLRQAAPRLGLRQGEITAAALERYLREHDF